MSKLHLILENGMIFEGESFGATGETYGELVFTTSMTGYLETLTDPSYFGQIVVQTFPLIGNYGVIPEDFESKHPAIRGYIAKDPCKNPSNFRSRQTLDSYLKDEGVIGLSGIDTRALTKVLREEGVMNGLITSKSPRDVDLTEISMYRINDALKSVSCSEPEYSPAENAQLTVALLDFGYKENIRRELLARRCNVWLLPHDTSPENILALKPDGIMLSNGPGNPAENVKVIENLKELMHAGIPIFGICLGHQLLALASGFKTHKLKYGHRGSNQAVKDVQTGRVYITSQNHGYAVTQESIDSTRATEWFVNVNDGSSEGITYRNLPISSVQFHPEACGGPHDTAYLFDFFVERMVN